MRPANYPSTKSCMSHVTGWLLVPGLLRILLECWRLHCSRTPGRTTRTRATGKVQLTSAFQPEKNNWNPRNVSFCTVLLCFRSTSPTWQNPQVPLSANQVNLASGARVEPVSNNLTVISYKRPHTRHLCLYEGCERCVAGQHNDLHQRKVLVRKPVHTTCGDLKNIDSVISSTGCFVVGQTCCRQWILHSRKYLRFPRALQVCMNFDCI